MTSEPLTRGIVSAALDYLHAGMSLLPVTSNKRPHGKALLSTGRSSTRDGRVVPSWASLQREHPSEDEVTAWFTHHPDAGIALVTGSISSLVIIDFDGAEGQMHARTWGIQPHVRTQSGGLHWYVRHPSHPVRTLQSQTNTNLETIRGVDIRGDGGYAVAPPTAFPTGTYWALRDPFDLDDARTVLSPDVALLLSLAEPPEAPKLSPDVALLLSLAEPQEAPKQHPQHNKVRRQPHTPTTGLTDDVTLLTRALDLAHTGHGRNASGFWLALQLRDHQYTLEDATGVMRRYTDQVPDTNTKGQPEAYELGEALASLRAAYARPPRKPWTDKRTQSPEQESVLSRLVRRWPTLDEQDRLKATRYVLACPPHLKDEGEDVLKHLGANLEEARRLINQALERNEVLPGLNALAKLLTSR